MKYYLLPALMMITFCNACKKAENAVAVSPASSSQVDSVSKVIDNTAATYIGTLVANATFSGACDAPGDYADTVTSFIYCVTITNDNSATFYMQNPLILYGLYYPVSYGGTFKIGILNNYSSASGIINDSLYINGSLFFNENDFDDYSGNVTISFAGKTSNTAVLAGQRRM